MTGQKEFAGKVAFVIGAAGGIGAAVVSALAQEGARVFATDIIYPDEIADHENVYHSLLDVSDPKAMKEQIAQAENLFGPIDLGVSVAGILKTGLVVETDVEDWQRVFDVNAGGVFHFGKALADVMIPRKRGAIVTVSSNAAGIPRHGMSAYASSKAAATMFTRCLGLELAAYGIRCNVVAPGSTRTQMLADMTGDEATMARLIDGVPETFKTGIPLRKLAQADDVAQAVLFLLSERASHITMTDIYVDGGATQRA